LHRLSDHAKFIGMWMLSMRDNKFRQWTDHGEFQTISAAAARILKLEGDGAISLFFKIYVDPPFGRPDTEIFYLG
jgi:hypothetical protein